MKNFRGLVGTLLFAVSSFGLTGGAYAQATVLNPGGSNTVGAALFTETFAGGSVVLGSQTTNFTSIIASHFTGTLFSEVITNDSNNPYGLTGMDFVYRLSNSDVSTDPIHRLTINGFANLSTSVAFFNSGDLAPSTVDRTASGETVGWSFSAPIVINGVTVVNYPGSLNPGPSGFSNFTDYLIVYTNASSFGLTNASVIDGSTASPLAFAPVPEPETYAMMLAGLGLMGFIARRRRGSKTSA